MSVFGFELEGDPTGVSVLLSLFMKRSLRVKANLLVSAGRVAEWIRRGSRCRHLSQRCPGKAYVALADLTACTHGGADIHVEFDNECALSLSVDMSIGVHGMRLSIGVLLND